MSRELRPFFLPTPSVYLHGKKASDESSEKFDFAVDLGFFLQKSSVAVAELILFRPIPAF